MKSTATAQRYTPEDLLKMPDGNRFELIDGQLVERNMSTLACYVAGVIFHLMTTYCKALKAGWPFPEGNTYQCFAKFPTMVRKADVSFIRLQRLSAAQAQSEGHCHVVPDLAVEVVSPNDTFYEVEEKTKLWLDAGVALVWVVNPQQRTVAVHRGTGHANILRENDELTGEDVLPGFRVKIADFFELPVGVV